MLSVKVLIDVIMAAHVSFSFGLNYVPWTKEYILKKGSCDPIWFSEGKWIIFWKSIKCTQLFFSWATIEDRVKLLDSSILSYHSKQLFISFTGQEPTTWPANNCLQIIVCSCTMLSNCVWLQIIFCTCVKETVLFSFLRSLLRENGRSLCFPRIYIKNLKQTRWSDDKTIIELGYRKILWFVISVVQ